MSDMLAFWLNQPANFLLLALVAAVVWLGWKAQRERTDIDFADVFRGDGGKVTWSRFGAIGSFIASTWVLVSYASMKIMPNELYYAYLLFWSGSAVAIKALEVWSGRPAQLPTPPPEPPAPTTVVNTNVNPAP